MSKVKYFKALEQSNQFNKNQKIWVVRQFPSDGYMWIVHKWRGKGRYIRAQISLDAKYIGEIKEIEVSDEFAGRINSKWMTTPKGV